MDGFGKMFWDISKTVILNSFRGNQKEMNTFGTSAYYSKYIFFILVLTWRGYV
jgi:hypothetical protein